MLEITLRDQQVSVNALAKHFASKDTKLGKGRRAGEQAHSWEPGRAKPSFHYRPVLEMALLTGGNGDDHAFLTGVLWELTQHIVYGTFFLSHETQYTL